MTHDLQPVSSPWMVLVVDFFQVFPVDVGINLGGGDVGVAEHLLDRPEIGAGVEKMSGKGVADRVRRDLLLQGGAADVLVQEVAHRPIAEPFPVAINEKRTP